MSNWSAETFPNARARFGFLSRFRDIVVSGEIGTKKPDPAIFGVLLERNRLTSQACVFIDPSAAIIRSAVHKSSGHPLYLFTQATIRDRCR